MKVVFERSRLQSHAFLKLQVLYLGVGGTVCLRALRRISWSTIAWPTACFYAGFILCATVLSVAYLNWSKWQKRQHWASHVEVASAAFTLETLQQSKLCSGMFAWSCAELFSGMLVVTIQQLKFLCDIWIGWGLTSNSSLSNKCFKERVWLLESVVLSTTVNISVTRWSFDATYHRNRNDREFIFRL